jgi:hypothetical protein
MPAPPNFIAGDTLTALQMNQVGMWKILSASINTGSVIAFTSCFTSDYTNYRIVINNLRTTGNVSLTMQLQASTIPSTTGYQYGQGFLVFGSPSWNLVSSAAASSWVAPGNTNTNPPANGYVDIYQPQVAEPTAMVAQYQSFDAAIWSNGVHNAGSNVYDGIRFISGGTFTSGTITIYGYRK